MGRSAKAAFSLLWWLTSGTATRHVLAQDVACLSATRPWIRLVVSPELPMSADSLLQRLRLNLAGLDLGVCLDGTAAPLATIQLIALPGAARVRVAIQDALTVKRVERDVDLTSIPLDGHPLTLAVVADELLQASWAELALPSVPEPQLPVPTSVAHAIVRSLRPPGRRWLGVAVNFDWYAGGQTQAGFDVQPALLVAPAFSLTGRLGARWAVPVQAPDGQILSSAWILGVGGSWSATRRDFWAGFEVPLYLDALMVRWSGEAADFARSHGATRLVVRAGLGGAVWFAPSPLWRLRLETGAGYVIVPSQAHDAAGVGDDRVVTGLSGPTLSGSLALTTSF